MIRANLDRAVAEIDEKALQSNYRKLHALAAAHSTAPRVCTIAVVKANAYGHGILHTVPPLLHAGCRFFAVAKVSAETLRSSPASTNVPLSCRAETHIRQKVRREAMTP